MTEKNPSTDDLKRTIVLIYGMLENSGTPFWVFAAVRPNKYQAFLTAYQDGKLDMYQFDPYGEIIVCGEGKAPPDEVTLKVAEMYQTSSATLMQAMQDDPPPEKP